MYPGRQPGSRTFQGLTIKAQLEKLCAAADGGRDRYTRSGDQNWRAKTIQNLVSTIIITITSTLAILLALDGLPMQWPAVCLAVTASISTLVIATRRYPEREAAHFQIAKRYGALALSSRQSVTRYEENQIGDSEFQALLDQHRMDWDLLRRDTPRR